MTAEGPLELVLRVDRVERGDDCPGLPRAELRDQELWTVGQQERDPVAAPDAQRQERRGARIAQCLEPGEGELRAFE
jgi:hypothetical protein